MLETREPAVALVMIVAALLNLLFLFAAVAPLLESAGLPTEWIPQQLNPKPDIVYSAKCAPATEQNPFICDFNTGLKKNETDIKVDAEQSALYVATSCIFNEGEIFQNPCRLKSATYRNLNHEYIFAILFYMTAFLSFVMILPQIWWGRTTWRAYCDLGRRLWRYCRHWERLEPSVKLPAALIFVRYCKKITDNLFVLASSSLWLGYLSWFGLRSYIDKLNDAGAPYYTYNLGNWTTIVVFSFGYLAVILVIWFYRLRQIYRRAQSPLEERRTS